VIGSRLWPVSLGFLVACGGAAIEERPVRPVSRTPLSVERIALPNGARAVSAWLGPSGDGVVALRDGQILALDSRGGTRPLDVSDDARAAFGAVLRLEPHGPAALAIVSDGALLVGSAWVRRAPLPEFLPAPRAFAALGPASLWATADGLFASDGTRWFSLETAGGPAHDITEVVPFAALGHPLEAWVLAGGALSRVRLGLGAKPSVTWVDPTPGRTLGSVRTIAALDDDRGAAMTARGVAIVGPESIVSFRSAESAGAPEALGGGGGWAYVGWANQLLRTDGKRWESLVRGLTFAPGVRIAVDPATGASAIVIDREGNVLRVRAEDALSLTGVLDGTVLFDSRIEVAAVPPRREGLRNVVFLLDNHEIASRTTAPFGLGLEGGPSRDLGDIAFGVHVLDVVAKFGRGMDLHRRIHFAYASPLGRNPSYRTDISPLFAARCARCHAGGVAHDLSTYQALRAQSVQVRAAIRDARMPPDISLDPASAAIFTAWVDADAPP
jgi:hypothetical protein